MIKQNQTYLNRLHVVMDAVCIYLAGYVAYYIRFKMIIHGFWLNKEIFEYNRYYKEFYQYQQPLIASLIFLLLLYSFWTLYSKTLSTWIKRTCESCKSKPDRTWSFCFCDHRIPDSEFSTFLISAFLFL